MSELKETLEALHEAAAQELLSRVLSKEAKPADIANAIKLLQHNNITCLPGVGRAGTALDRLRLALPFKEGDGSDGSDDSESDEPMRLHG